MPPRRPSSQETGLAELTPSQIAARNRAEMEVRRQIWHSHVLGGLSSVAAIATHLGLTEEEVEQHWPHIEAFVKRDAEITRATIREAQLKDLLDSIAECGKLLKKAKLPAALRLATIDRKVKLWDRLSKLEGLDRHKERVEISGANGSNLQIDHQVAAGIVDMYRSRRKLEQAEGRIIPPRELTSGDAR